jgi:pimeloyl-ACP methyl ester carboxylesterase
MQTGTSDSTSDTTLEAPAGVSLPPVDVLLDDHGAGDAAEADTPGPNAIRYRLPLVAVPDNVLLKAAVQKLVEQKAQLDVLARNPALAGLLPADWQGSGVRAVDLQGFVLSVLPFLQNAAKANIPVLLYVGDRDVRTPAFHARSFFNAIKGTVPAKLEMIADMPHSMPWYPRHHQQTLKLIEDFLAKDCGPGGL